MLLPGGRRRAGDTGMLGGGQADVELAAIGPARRDTFGPASFEMNLDRGRHLTLQVLDRAAVERDHVAGIDHLAEEAVDLLVVGDAGDVVAVTHQSHGDWVSSSHPPAELQPEGESAAPSVALLYRHRAVGAER